jgi:hypothetical protein
VTAASEADHRPAGRLQRVALQGFFERSSASLVNRGEAQPTGAIPPEFARLTTLTVMSFGRSRSTDPAIVASRMSASVSVPPLRSRLSSASWSRGANLPTFDLGQSGIALSKRL